MTLWAPPGLSKATFLRDSQFSLEKLNYFVTDLTIHSKESKSKMEKFTLTAIPEFEAVEAFEDAKIDPVLKGQLESIHIRIEMHYARKMERLRLKQELEAAEAEAKSQESKSQSSDDDKEEKISPAIQARPAKRSLKCYFKIF
jgi:hypothetical protein